VDPHPDVAVGTGDLELEVSWLAVFDGVRDRLGRDEVRRRRDVVRYRPSGRDRELDRNRNCRDECRESGVEPVVETARPQPVREPAKVSHGPPELGHPLVEQPGHDLVRAHVSPGDLPLRESQRQTEGDQALLGAIVEVALEPAPFLVAHLLQAGAAGFGLRQRQGGLRAQANQLHQRRRGRRDLAEQPLGGGPGGRQRSDRLAGAQHRDPASRVVRRRARRDGGQHQVGVMESTTEHRLQLLGHPGTKVDPALEVADRRQRLRPERVDPTVDDSPQPADEWNHQNAHAGRDPSSRRVRAGCRCRRTRARTRPRALR
jgi:hypothetical protein